MDYSSLLLAIVPAFFLQLCYERAEAIARLTVRLVCRLLPEKLRLAKQEQGEADIIFIEGNAWKIVGALGIACDVVPFACRVHLNRLVATIGHWETTWRSVKTLVVRLFASAVCGSVFIVVAQYLLLGYWPSFTKIAFCAVLSCIIALATRFVARRFGNSL